VPALTLEEGATEEAVGMPQFDGKRDKALGKRGNCDENAKS
jgi:hypothetical protein